MASKQCTILLKCDNSNCALEFKKAKSKLSANNFCSLSCSASVNNHKFPKNPGIRKSCKTCLMIFVSREKYCSLSCKWKDQVISKDLILEEIKNFFLMHNRIPLKKEFTHTKAARNRFGSWNKAIIAMGYTPNPVMFAQKHTAKDGHECDSLSEKIIDDWLYRRGITHKRSISYPGNPKLTVDFVVDDYWIEFFGLYGEHKRYDELRKEKLKLAEEYHLKLIEIYPNHLFPKNKLKMTVLPFFNS